MFNGFNCSICGRVHPPAPTSYSIKAPQPFIDLPMEEREERTQLNSDQCIIDDQRFFLRGRILIPILSQVHQPIRGLPFGASDEHAVLKVDAPFFAYGCWAEVTRTYFFRTRDLWEVEGRESEPAFDASLASALSPYPQTLGLAVRITTQPKGRRPHFTVLDSSHPLTVEQRAGLQATRIQEIAEQIQHHNDGG